MRTCLALVVGAVVVAVGLGVGLGVGLSGSNSSPAASLDQAQLSSIQTGCQQWLTSAPAASGPAPWCRSMTSWMNRYGQRSGFNPQAMWGDPGQLTSMCTQWLQTSPPAGAPADPGQWCSSMVGWMSAHLGSWSGQGSWSSFMQHGPMGGPAR